MAISNNKNMHNNGSQIRPEKMPYIPDPQRPTHDIHGHLHLWDDFAEAKKAIYDIHLRTGETHTEFYKDDTGYHCVVGVGNYDTDERPLLLTDSGSKGTISEQLSELFNVVNVINNKYTTELNNIQATIDSMLGSVSAHDGDIKAISDSLLKLLNTLTLSVQQLTSKIAANTQNIASNTSAINRLDSLVGTNAANIDNLKKATDELVTSLKDVIGQVTTLNESDDLQNNAINEITSSISSIKNSAGDQSKKLDDLNNSLNTIKSNLEKAQNSITQVSTSLNDVKNTVNVQKTILDGIKTDIQSLKNADQSNKAEITHIKEANQKQDSSIATQASLISDIQTAVNDINVSLNDIDKAIKANNATDVKQTEDINNIKTDISGIKTDISSVRSGVSDINLKLKDIDAALVNINSSVAEASGNINDIKAHAVDQDKNILLHDNKINMLTDSIAQINTAIENQHEQDHQHDIDINNLSHEISALKEQDSDLLTNITEHKGSVEKVFNKVSGEINNLKSAIKAENDAVSAISVEIAQNIKDIEALEKIVNKQAYDELDNEVANLEKSLQQTLDTLLTATLDITVLKTSSCALSENISVITEKQNALQDEIHHIADGTKERVLNLTNNINKVETLTLKNTDAINDIILKLSAASSGSASSLTELNIKLNNVIETLNSNKETIADNKSKVSTLLTVTNDLKNGQSELKDSVNDLQKDLSKATVELNAAKASVTSNASDIKALNEKVLKDGTVITLIKQTLEDMSAIDDQHTTDIAELYERILAATSDIADNINAIAANAKDIVTVNNAVIKLDNKLNQKFNELTDSISKVSKDLNDYKSANDQTIDQLSKNLASNTQDVNKLKDDSKNVNVRIDNVENNIHTVSDKLAELKASTSESLTNLENLHQDNAVAIADVNSSISNINKAIETVGSNIAELHADVSVLTAKHVLDIEALNDLHKANVTSIEKVEEKIQNLDTSVAAFEKDVTATLSDINKNISNIDISVNNHINDNINKFNNIDTSINDIYNALTEHDDKFKDVETAIGNISEGISSIQDSLDVINVKLSDVSSAVDQNTESINELQNGMSEMKSCCEDVHESLTTIQSNISELQGEVIDLTELNNEIKEHIDASVGELTLKINDVEHKVITTDISDASIGSLFDKDIYTVNLCGATPAGHIQVSDHLDELPIYQNWYNGNYSYGKYKTYVTGDDVSLTAIVNEGYRFKEWLINGKSKHITDPRLDLTFVDKDINVTPTLWDSLDHDPLNDGYTALYSKLFKLNVDVSISNWEDAQLSGDTVDVQSYWNEPYVDRGDNITLTEQHIDKHEFEYYLVDGKEKIYNEKYTLYNISNDHDIIAMFKEKRHYFIAESRADSGGDVRMTIINSTYKNGQVLDGSSVMLEAVPISGYKFSHWLFGVGAGAREGQRVYPGGNDPNPVTFEHILTDYYLVAIFTKI